MHLRGLALFREIYWAGSITAGAAALNISQPAASRMLRHLEDQLGYALFERAEGRAKPTAEARVLIAEVDAIFARVRRTSQVARNLKRGAGERLAVVGPHLLAITLLPFVMKRLQSRFPDLELRLDAQGLVEQLNSLECHQADIGIAADMAAPPGVEARELGRSGFVALMPACHPLAAQRTVALADYARFPSILWGDVGPLGRVLNARFAEQGVRPDVRMTIGSPMLVENVVRAFGYLSVIDKFAAATLARAPDLAIRDLEPEVDFALFAFWRPAAPPSAIRDAFLDMLGEALRPILQPYAGPAAVAAIG